MYQSAGGSTENMDGYEELVLRGSGTEPGTSVSTPLNHSPHGAPGSGMRPGRRQKGLISEEDLRTHSFDAGFGSGGHGNAGHRPRSADYSCNTSSSSSPVISKESLERRQGRSANLCSDDVGLAYESPVHSQSSLLPRSFTLPCDAMPSPSLLRNSCPRPRSPGSEMVTLEEFLQESNTVSPPTVHTGSREDLMTDYFTRVGRPTPPPRDGTKTPTSYVTPTVKPTPSGPERRAAKPGHSVKPSVRLTDSGMSPSQSQTLPNRGTGGTGGRLSHLQHSGPHAISTSSLSRTFSLASADLLHSNGPDSYRIETSSPVQVDGVPRRERTHSARLTGVPGQVSVDPRRLSVAHPREEMTLSSSSTSLQQDRGYAGSVSRSGGSRSNPSHHRGEVALVTPVRAVSTLKLEEVEERREPRQTEPSSLKKSDKDGPTSHVEERPMSTPASPDPNNDQQTVWYEYGCV